MEHFTRDRAGTLQRVVTADRIDWAAFSIPCFGFSSMRRIAKDQPGTTNTNDHLIGGDYFLLLDIVSKKWVAGGEDD